MKLKPLKRIILFAICIFTIQTINAEASNKKIKPTAVDPDKQQTLTIALKNRNQKQLDQFIYQTVTPGNGNYRQYLTPTQFGNKYGLSSQNIKVVGNYMTKHHLKVNTYPGNLIMTVTGKTKDIDRAFQVKLVQIKHKKLSYQTKRGKYKLPNTIRKNITYVTGFSKLNRSANDSNNDQNTQATKITDIKDPNISDQSYQKFGRNYNTASLYQNNNGGQKQTIGIISLSDYKNSDIQHYLNEQKVNADSARIQKTYVENSYSPKNHLEVTMDIEQAAAAAPQATIKTFIGNNWLLDYATAIAKDNVDVITNSYGSFETDYLKQPNEIKAINMLLQQAAAQGITAFAASGDNGAYAFAEGSTKRSTTFPASSPYNTAIGGTTLPFKNVPFSFFARHQVPNDKVISLNREHSWTSSTIINLFGRDYIIAETNALYKEALAKAKTTKEKIEIAKQNKPSKLQKMMSFSGSGGGFSAIFALPQYQQGVDGTQNYNAKQVINLEQLHINSDVKTFSGTQTGRNVPDLSGNADPYTGYAVYFNGKTINNSGGTSIVSPQFAGMAAVINSAQGQRMGFWNPQIYRFAQSSNSPFTPLNDDDDDNLYYTGQPGKIYNQATGLGTVDFTKLNQAFSNEK